jgi:hypothetical protein
MQTMAKANGLVVMFLFAGVLIAKPPDKSRLMNFPTPIVVNGAAIPAGTYRLGWETHANSVTVQLFKGSEYFAGSKGKWVKQGMKYAEDAVLLRVNGDGSRSLSEIRLAGYKKTIVFTDPILELKSTNLAPAALEKRPN